jgi:hypothetical protein
MNTLNEQVNLLQNKINQLEKEEERKRKIENSKFWNMIGAYQKLLKELNSRDSINSRLINLEKITMGNNNLINKLINKNVGVVSHLKIDTDISNNFNNRFEQLEEQIIKQNEIINDLFSLLKK